MDASQAMIVPAPGGPSVVAVVEQRYSNAVEQKVILSTSAATSGQNMLKVQMFGPMERATDGIKSLSFRSLHTADLGREIRAAVPGVAMQTSGLFLRNNYGPFGYAFGRGASGDACIYGWQQLRANDRDHAGFSNAGAIQVRLRLCEAGASEKELLSVMYGYTLTGSFNSSTWNPYGTPQGIDPAIGSDGNPVYPRDAELSAAARVSTPASVRRQASAVVRSDRDVLEQQKAEDAAKQIVDVPSPSVDQKVVAPSDASEGSRVVVPGPGCDSQTGECN